MHRHLLVSDVDHVRVGVARPHPEATIGWFTDAGLPVPRDGGDDLARDLVDHVLED